MVEKSEVSSPDPDCDYRNTVANKHNLVILVRRDLLPNLNMPEMRRFFVEKYKIDYVTVPETEKQYGTVPIILLQI